MVIVEGNRAELTVVKGSRYNEGKLVVKEVMVRKVTIGRL